VKRTPRDLEDGEHVPGQLTVDDALDVRPTILSLFSGYAGLDMAVRAVLGGHVVAHAEYEPPTPDRPAPTQAAARVLAYRYPHVRPGTRSGLWSQVVAAVDVLRPPLIIVENVRGLLSADAAHPAHGDVEPCPWCMGDADAEPLRALGAVLGDLADLGYDAAWHLLSAADVGAPHGRARVFLVAWPADADSGGRRPDVDGVRAWQPDPAGGAAAHPDGAPRRPRAAVAGAGARAHGQRAPQSRRRGAAAADPDGSGQQALGWVDAGRGDADGRGRADGARDATEPETRDDPWGEYGAAVRRWERLLGRSAPPPTLVGPRGGTALSPRFVEWMQGLPDGWVTAVPGLEDTDALRLLGNGVVPQQAAAALRLLLPHVQTAAPPASCEAGGAA
jgi:DNA (cytosine-5)-methyltransferase 1